jgi:hypothetical protein
MVRYSYELLYLSLLLLELFLVKDESEGFLMPKKNVMKLHNGCGGSAPRVVNLVIR